MKLAKEKLVGPVFRREDQPGLLKRTVRDDLLTELKPIMKNKYNNTKKDSRHDAYNKTRLARLLKYHRATLRDVEKGKQEFEDSDDDAGA